MSLRCVASRAHVRGATASCVVDTTVTRAGIPAPHPRRPSWQRPVGLRTLSTGAWMNFQRFEKKQKKIFMP